MRTAALLSTRLLSFARQVLDNGGKGFISVAELGHVLSNIGEKLSPDELADLTKEADPEGKGIVQYEHFVKVRRLDCPMGCCGVSVWWVGEPAVRVCGFARFPSFSLRCGTCAGARHKWDERIAVCLLHG